MAKTYVYFETNWNEKIEPIKFKKKIENLPVLERPGYKFVGWFEENNGEEKEFDISLIYKEDVKLFAKWQPLTIDELLNDLEHFSKTVNVLKELQNDYGDIPEIKEPKTVDINKKQSSKKKDSKGTAKKKTQAKKTTKTKKVAPKKDEIVAEENQETVEVIEESNEVVEAIE